MAFEIKITGIKQLLTNIKKLEKLALEGVERGVQVSTAQLRKDVLISMQGSVPPGHFAGVSRKFTGFAGAPGTGLEIPPVGAKGAIGLRTNKLRSNLQMSITKSGQQVSGEVGYSRSITPKTPPGRATRNRIDFPKKGLTIGIVVTPIKAPGNPFPHINRGNISPNQYIPIVLLGDQKIIGRNVLRTALIGDIMSRRTIRTLTREVSSSIKKI